MPFYSSRMDGGNANGSSSGNYSGDDRDLRSGHGQYERSDNDLIDKPVYLLEHLATFTVNGESGIVYPSDGMRRLLQLEKTTGIWSQKMQLCLDRQWVLIMDYETGNIIERFPASLIKEPTAFTSNGPTELYNNILVFIVDGGSGSRSEMHIFQCQSISAVHLTEHLRQLRDGKSITEHHDASPPHQSQQQFLKSQGVVSSSKHHSNTETNPAAYNTYNQDTDSELGMGMGAINDDASSTSSEKYERDVTVLNHCFDDIEKFIARLQHAAAASRELERRRRNKKSKKKDPGEGLLTLRTKPPHEKEFVDIFAKFKLSFNLLAKLKAHIHDPNAPELVHFLFTPLALIVDASHDTYYDPNLPARVINPLLTREAINLLINCVTSKETELWRSLGDAWSIPRDQWKGQGMVLYHPVFFDGWSPDYPVIDELDAHVSTPPPPPVDGSAPNATQQSVMTSTNAIKRRMEQQQQQQQQFYSIDYDYDTQPTQAGPPHSPGLRDFSARSDISIDSIERNGGIADVSGIVGGGGNNAGNISGNGINNQAISHDMMTQNQSIDTWLDNLHARGSKVVQVTYPRTANNDKELTVARGEYLEVIDDSRKWWKARNSRGQVAHVPHTIVTPFNFTGNNMVSSNAAAGGGAGGTLPDSSSGIATGDVFNNPLYVQQKQPMNAKNGNRQMNDSLSERYTQYGNEPQHSSLASPAAPTDWVRNKHIDNRTVTDVPIPQPPPPLLELNAQDTQNNNVLTLAILNRSTVLKPADTNDKKTEIKSNASSSDNGNSDNMNEELTQVLKLYREKRCNWDIHKTPEIFIQHTSSPAEVKQWLKAKGFSDYVIGKLGYLNGFELFSLTRETLEEHCGIDEGRRLLSQITIQRNVSGYKTTRSSELLACLAKARKRIDQE